MGSLASASIYKVLRRNAQLISLGCERFPPLRQLNRAPDRRDSAPRWFKVRATVLGCGGRVAECLVFKRVFGHGFDTIFASTWRSRGKHDPREGFIDVC